MSRETLISEMAHEALAEDAREGGEFDMEGFGNFFPEYLMDALRHGIQWDNHIWSEAYGEYQTIRNARHRAWA